MVNSHLEIQIFLVTGEDRDLGQIILFPGENDRFLMKTWNRIHQNTLTVNRGLKPILTATTYMQIFMLQRRCLY